MYQNNQLELLINAYEGSIPHDITLIIAKIQSIYKVYNADYSRYTQKLYFYDGKRLQRFEDCSVNSRI